MYKIYIGKSKIHGYGVFSNTLIYPGEKIFVSLENKNDGNGNIVTYIGSKINHSFKPNTKLVLNPYNHSHDIVAIRHINQYEELTVDYTFTPSDIMKPKDYSNFDKWVL